MVEYAIFTNGSRKLKMKIKEHFEDGSVRLIDGSILENEFISVKEQLPEKGKDIIGIDKDGNKHYCFRCACHNLNCKEWRCSLTGYGLIIDVVKWKYEQK